MLSDMRLIVWPRGPHLRLLSVALLLCLRLVLCVGSLHVRLRWQATIRLWLLPW